MVLGALRKLRMLPMAESTNLLDHARELTQVLARR